MQAKFQRSGKFPLSGICPKPIKKINKMFLSTSMKFYCIIRDCSVDIFLTTNFLKMVEIESLA